ncbi:MAG: holo-[acyl-carrier-protein] synthase [candidate division Zixibacteria bacterium]|nr:holo-[acyl-carrier-protein] synthase [candidate division Zixibacteria bacterium]
MIDSVGIDIIEVHRIKKAIERWGDSFLHRVYTPWEINYCQNKQFPEQSFAARFAVKEAVLKAIGTGLSEGVKWVSIEVVNTSMGKPTVRLGERITNIIGDKEIIISMSHTREHAIASAILYKD